MPNWPGAAMKRAGRSPCEGAGVGHPRPRRRDHRKAGRIVCALGIERSVAKCRRDNLYRIFFGVGFRFQPAIGAAP